ncbi:LPS translocon maturation chaperone LptM [Ideonella paludis]|uniref:LPS translocon maturation chaperone LptM n=1 Tax=Ideonella paludis TaxID=1233411 RepID=UPI0035C01F64
MHIDQSRSVVVPSHSPLPNGGFQCRPRPARLWSRVAAVGLLVGLLQACGQRGPLVMPAPTPSASPASAASAAPAR